MQSGLEILELDPSGSDYVRVRVALNGHLVTPFEFPKSDYVETFRDEAALLAFIERQASTLLDTYGDARESRPDFAA